MRVVCLSNTGSKPAVPGRILIIGNNYAYINQQRTLIRECVVLFGGRGYPVRRYPIACRLRDRKGRAIQCSRFNLGVGTPRAFRS